MIFRVFSKDQLEELYQLLAVNHIVGPVCKAKKPDQSTLYDFEYVYDFAELALDYSTTIHSLKRFFLPANEILCSYIIENDGWQKAVEFNTPKPTVFFGLHACDINALKKLDKVLNGSIYPDPYYATKRTNMFIIGVNCLPSQSCFCRSMGSDSVLHGFDMFLTDIGDAYFVEILSAKAFEYINAIKSREPDEHDDARFVTAHEKRINQFSCHVETNDLTKILDLEFQSEVWEEWGKRCLSCGTCASVCPTCYCYDISENVNLDLSRATKSKQLYSCNLIDFAQVAGGHNFRPESHDRIKYRYYHKHRGFVEAFEEPLCVGCGRCGISCLAGITVPDVIASVREQGGTVK